MGTAGWAAWNRAIPSGAARRQRNVSVFGFSFAMRATAATAWTQASHELGYEHVERRRQGDSGIVGLQGKGGRR